jgi:hypothetical protein
MAELKSEGQCVFCNEVFDRAVISRHLKTHFTKMEKTTANENSYHIKVENESRSGKSPYFLNLWLSHKARFEDIDDFLRGIWVECCGHMSSFTDIETRKKNRKAPYVFDFNFDKKDEAEIDMSKKVSKLFYEKQKIEYQYDFGTTTTLLLTVVAVLPIKAPNTIMLLSRNEPLELICETCKKEPATQICSVHGYNGEDNIFCRKCAKKHAKICDDFDDYAAMPIVNSPRMGECAYEGGNIDKGRDDVYFKK